MKKYRFAALVAAIMLIIYALCNNVPGRAARLAGTYIIGDAAADAMPVYAYIKNIEHSEKSITDKITDSIYPVNQYAREQTSIYSYDGKNIQEDTNDNGITDNAAGDSNVNNVNNSSAADNNNNNSNNTGNGNSSNTGSSASQAVTEGQNENAAQTQSVHNSAGEADSGINIQDKVQSAVSNNIITGSIYPRASLNNYNFVMSNFYTVTSITELGSDKLRPEEFLNKDMKITHDAATPQILIFHTHSQEAFADSVEGDTSDTIVGVGDYLTQLLTQKYGYNVIHDKSVYDFVDGKLDRSKAYTYAEEAVASILAKNPSIEVVIDLHRDGVAESTHLVTQVNGKQTAKIMFFNGLSYSKVNGDISYLKNPNRDDNLALSLQMQLMGNAYYPGLLRRIYVNAYRYCLHMRGKSMLIEAGAQNNTVEEVMNAMEPLADLLDKTLQGKKCW